MTCRISLGGHFTERSEGRTYRRLRDPEIITDIQRGVADIGFLGSDKFEEWQPRLGVDWVGEVPDCDFVLAALAGTVTEVEARLDAGRTVYAITSNIKWLAKFAVVNAWDLDVRQVSGSAEAYGEEADMIADLRVSGNSLRDNGMEEFRVLDSVRLGMVYRQPVGVRILQ